MGWGDTRRPAALAQRAAAFARWAVRLLGAHQHSAISQISNFVSRSFSRREIVFAVLISCAAVTALVSLVAVAQEQPFNPIHKLTTWYTDRSHIDIEVVGSTSFNPEHHRLEPDRRLRFRLERAYVGTLMTGEAPGFEIVSFKIDLDTGLPNSLFFAVSSKGQFHEDIPGVPELPFSEEIRRLIVINLQSDHSAASIERFTDIAGKCTGASIGNGLSTYEWRDREGCDKPLSWLTRWLADYDNKSILRIECQDDTFRGVGCQTRFPFAGFAVGLSFHRSHLNEWRKIVNFASSFLTSKEYG
jgi:hypothetical protein